MTALHLKATFLSSAYLISLFIHAGSAPKWSWGKFAQTELLSKDACQKGRCIEKWKCSYHFTLNISSDECINQNGGPWVCCINTTERLTNSKELVPSELPPQSLTVATSFTETSYARSTEGRFLETPQRRRQRNNENNFTNSKEYVSESISEYSTRTARFGLSDNSSSRSRETEIETERYKLLSNKTGVKLLTETSLRRIYSNTVNRNGEHSRNITTPGQNRNAHNSTVQIYDSHSEKSRTNTPEPEWIRNPNSELTNNFSDWMGKETTELKKAENLWYRPYPSGSWSKSTNAYGKSTTKLPRKPTNVPWHGGHTWTNEQSKSTKFKNTVTTTPSWTKPTRSSPNDLYSSSTRKSLNVWVTEKIHALRKPTKSSWVRDSSSTYFRERTNAQGKNTTITSRKPTNVPRHGGHTSNDQSKSTKFKNTVTTTPSWAKPTRSSPNDLYSSSTRKSSNVWVTEKIHALRKPTKSSWVGYSSSYFSERTNAYGTKTSPLPRWKTTKTSWSRNDESDYSRTSVRTWEGKTTPNSRRSTTQPSWNGQNTHRSSVKPTKASWDLEHTSDSRKKSTKTWESDVGSRSTHKSSTLASRTSKYTTSRPKSSTRVAQPSKKTTLSPRITTRKAITRESSVLARNTPLEKQTTKTTIGSRRTSPEKYDTTTPLPDINSRICGIRDTNAVNNRRGKRDDDDNDRDVVIVYPNSRETNDARQSFQRIVGGKEAEPFSWPWVAALYKVTSSGGNRFLCAGSLINEHFVLTAAHVFTPEDLRSSSFVVMLGTHTGKEALAEYTVMYVLQHPKYEQRYYYNDVALLRLVRPVTFNDFVVPVCLPSPSMPFFRDSDLIGKKVTVMGWGDESFGGVTSRVLKEATFPILNRQSCNASYLQVVSNRFPRGITHDMLCAGSPNGGKDACQGDSGGPLTATENGRYTQVGIVSFGYKCGDKDYPGVYTKVSSFLSWIAENARCDIPSHDYDYRDSHDYYHRSSYN